MNLLRASLFAVTLAVLAGPAMALSVAVDPETGEPLANPPTIFLTLHEEAGEAAGDYMLREFSFRLAPSPESYDSLEDGRPRFSLIGIETLDANLLAWAQSGEDASRSVTIEILPQHAGGTALLYTLEDVVVHYINGFHVWEEGEQSSASLELSAGSFSVEDRVIQTIEN